MVYREVLSFHLQMEGRKEGGREGRPRPLQKEQRPGNGGVVTQGCEHPVSGGCGQNPGKNSVLGLPKLMRKGLGRLRAYTFQRMLAGGQ